MSAASDPSSGSPIPIQAIPPKPAGSRDSLSASQPSGNTPERLGVEIVRLDRVLVAGVLLLAFFVASFAATNSDLWMHLAAGRLIAQGNYAFGTDPFAYTTEGVRWINNAWLSDLALYGFSRALGGPDTDRGGAALVLLKAALIVILAGAMLMTSRREQSLWAPVVCTTLALLAMSSRLFLQPTCCSFLFLGLTLYLLHRNTEEKDFAAHAPHWTLYLLPPLFALWTNLDSWFFLGPVVAGLFLLGQILQAQFGPGRNQVPTAPSLGRLAVVMGLGLLACLANPYHIHAFTLPPELQPALSSSPLREDRVYLSFFLSPFNSLYFERPELGQNTSGLAYLLLVAGGVLSFLCRWSALRWWRVLVWLVFFALSAYRARLIPMFVVVAAPIMALNLQDWAVATFGVRPQTDGKWQAWSLGGRVASALGLVALLALVWPGWLYTITEDPRWNRRVTWQVPVDESLRRAAAALSELRRQGALGTVGHGFGWSPDVVNYCAWYCPEEKGFFDYRYHLFTDEVTRDFLTVRQSLSSTSGPFPGAVPRDEADSLGDRAAVSGIFRGAQINHLILHGADTDTIRAQFKLWLDPGQWILLYMDGRTTIFGWHDTEQAASADSWAAHRWEAEAQAFRHNLGAADRAPAPNYEAPKSRGAWDRFWHSPPPHPLAADEAKLYLSYGYAANILSASKNVQLNFANCFGSLAAAAASGRGVCTQPLWFSYLQYPPRFMQGEDPESAAIPLLAVRAGLRAVAASPQDADAYLALAAAYSSLRIYQNSRWSVSTPFLNEIRDIQLVSALQHALTLRPESKDAHGMIAAVYYQMNYQVDDGDAPAASQFDLFLEHRKEWLRLERASGPQRGELREAFEKRMAAEAEFIKQQEQSLSQRQTDFELRAEKQSPFTKARLALQRGLAKKAVEILTETDAAQLNQQEVEKLITLLLRSGRIDDVLRDLADSTRDEWNKVLLAAAVGDYGRADQYLAEIQATVDKRRAREMLDLIKSQPLPFVAVPQRLSGISRIAAWTQRWADLEALRGLLAVEAGRTGEAAEHFRKAFSVNNSPKPLAWVAALLAAPSPLALAALSAQGPTLAGEPAFQFDYAPMAARYSYQLRRANGN